jgi:hypothetical protein
MIVEGNDIGYQGDDSINLYSSTTPVLSADGTKVSVAAVCDPDPMDEPGVGDLLAFFDANMVYKGSARVTAAEGAVCAPTLHLTLEHAIAGLNSQDSAIDLTQQPAARYVIRGNLMHECRCRGTLVNAPYGSIDHNFMFDNSSGGILLDGGNGNGPAATNLVIAENSISYPGQPAQWNGAISMMATDAVGNLLAQPVFEKIEIVNNTIADTPGPAILTASAKYFSVGGNFLSDTNTVQSMPTTYGSLSTLDSILVYESSDGSVCEGFQSGATTGPTGIDPSDADVLLVRGCAW